MHTPLVAGIAGTESKGAFSIVFSCSYEDDIDLGERFYYTASGGRESAGKARVGGPQVKDQELKRCNKALALNCHGGLNEASGANAGLDWRKGRPVRVLRNGNARGASKRSPYLPAVGIRYDGIYKVVKYWPQKGESGFLVWRYLLQRDDPAPAPWTKKGKELIYRLGLRMIYPEGWPVVDREVASETREKETKRKSTPLAEICGENDNDVRAKKARTNPFAIPSELTDLMLKDKPNVPLWNGLRLQAKMGKLVSAVFMLFVCF